MKKTLNTILITFLITGALFIGSTWWFQKDSPQSNTPTEQAEKHDNIVYFVENNKAHPFLLNGKLYSNDTMEPKTTEREASKQYSLVPITQVPEKTYLFSVKFTGENNNIVVFGLQTILSYKHQKNPNIIENNNPVGYERSLITYYKYHIDTHDIDPLFANADHGLAGRFPVIQDVSDDGNYIALNVFACFECGGHQPDTFVYDFSKQKAENFGKMYDFAWKDNGNYEYKEYIEIPCDDPDQPYICSKAREVLEVKQGRL